MERFPAHAGAFVRHLPLDIYLLSFFERAALHTSLGGTGWRRISLFIIIGDWADGADAVVIDIDNSDNREPVFKSIGLWKIGEICCDEINKNAEDLPCKGRFWSAEEFLWVLFADWGKWYSLGSKKRKPYLLCEDLEVQSRSQLL